MGAYLPAANACFNALCACCLIAGFVNIKRGNRERHMRCMLAALVFSVLFLASYIPSQPIIFMAIPLFPVKDRFVC